MKRIYILLLIFPLSGCVTSTGLKLNDLPEITADNSVAYIYYPKHNNWSTGLLARLTAIDSTKIYIDKISIARIDEKMFTRIKVASGHHIFTTSTDKQMACHGQLFSKFGWPPIEINIKPKEIIYLRYSVADYSGSESRGGTCDRHLEKVDENTALEEIDGLDFVKPQKAVYH